MAQMFGLSRTRAADLIARGLVQVDGAAAAKSDRVLAGADARRDHPGRGRPARGRAGGRRGHPDHPRRPVHRGDRQAGRASPCTRHPAGPARPWSGTWPAAGFRIATSGASERQGIVQRLDVGTSGVMVICKSEHAYSVLKNAFRHRDVDKVYHALVQGHPDPLEGTIDAPIGRHPKADYKFAVMADGRPSVTHYSTLEAHRFAVLLEVHLETGRTHQIRVHMAALKHPCVGDLTYGADPTLAKRVGLERQWLHAVKLGFEHPDSGRVRRVRVGVPRRPGRGAGGRSVVPTDARAPPGAPTTTSRRWPSCPSGPATRRTPPCRRHPPRPRGPGLASAAGTSRQYDVWVAESTATSGRLRPGDRDVARRPLRRARPRRRSGRRQRAARRGQGPAARAASACGSSRSNEPARAFYRAPRPGRARAHRRLRQRGEGPRHPDGLARHRPARLLPLA